MPFFIFTALYYFLPAYFANMAPIFVKKIPILGYPVDGGGKFRGKRIFGENKTWRGVLFGTFLGTVVFLIQKELYLRGIITSSLINYGEISILFGVLMSFGALLGDMIKSFFKRQLGKKPGESWVGFDQIDYTIGGLLLSFIYFIPPINIIILVLIISPILHLIVRYVGYLANINKQKI